MTQEEKDRIQRAEEIQRYTENRCDVLEKENAELKAQIEEQKAYCKAVDEVNEKMKCCGNCKHCVFKYDDEDLIFECDINGMESYTHLKTCINWELAE